MICKFTFLIFSITTKILIHIFYPFPIWLILARGITCNIIWNKQFGEDGVIISTSLLTSGQPIPFTFHSCPLVSFIYQACRSIFS